MEAYLDNSATTRAYPEVGDLVYKVMCQDYGNPSSMHRKGVDAEHYVKEAKETIAKVLKVNAKDIYFTSGGTESDNLALIGCARANRRAGNHLITTSIEHPAILNTMRRGRVPCDISSGRCEWKSESGSIERSTLSGDDSRISYVCEQ